MSAADNGTREVVRDLIGIVRTLLLVMDRPQLDLLLVEIEKLERRIEDPMAGLLEIL